MRNGEFKRWLQSLFDIAVTQLRAQGGACTTSGIVDSIPWTPALGSIDGGRCFIGALVSDEMATLSKYHTCSESSGAVLNDVINGRSLTPRQHKKLVDFLRDGRYIHDDRAPRDWEDRFQAMAKDWGLKVPDHEKMMEFLKRLADPPKTSETKQQEEEETLFPGRRHVVRPVSQRCSPDRLEPNTPHRSASASGPVCNN